MYTLRALQVNDEPQSNLVFFLCADETTPLESFAKTCKDKLAIEKITRAIISVQLIGIAKSKQFNRITCLNKGRGSDLYEIRASGCTARAYSYLIDNEDRIVIAFIEQTTHSGTGKKDTKRATEKLEKMRPLLQGAMMERCSNDSTI